MKKIITGVGMLVFVAAIVAGGTGAFFSDTETSTGNVFTAGAIDLTVDSEAHYNGMICVPNTNTTENPNDYWWQPESQAVQAPYYPAKDSACNGTWTATNLGAEHKFFNYGDVKPGDEGENTISLHIDSNPAWACVDVNITKNDDVSVTEPEDGEVLELDTPVSEPDADMFDGELAQNLKFAAWLDQGNTLGWQGKGQDVGEGDNVWQGPTAEPLLFSNQSGPASDVLGGVSYPLAMPGLNNSTPIAPNQTNYIGLAWCAGTQTVGANAITCDGSTLGNIIQTDSMEATIAFRVEQSRNNPNFSCTPRVAPVVTTLTLGKAVLPPTVALDTDFTLTADGVVTDISGVEGQASITNAIIQPGVYSLFETGGPVVLAPLSRVWECSGNATPEVDNLDGTATVTIAAGENVVCGITNTYPQN